MFLIKGWTQTCVQNLIKIPPAQSPKTISTAWPLAWPRTVGALADHRPEDPTCLKCLSVQKRNPTSPSLDRTQPAESRAQHLIFAPYEVSIKTGRARLQLLLMAIFFQHQFGLIFFPPRIRTGDGAGYGAMVGAAGEVVEKISTGASTAVRLGQHI